MKTRTQNRSTRQTAVRPQPIRQLEGFRVVHSGEPFPETCTLASAICPACLGNGRHVIASRYCFTCGGRGSVPAFVAFAT